MENNERNTEWRKDTQKLFDKLKELKPESFLFQELDGDSQYEMFERLLLERHSSPESSVMRNILFGSKQLSESNKNLLKIGFKPLSNSYSKEEYYSDKEMRLLLSDLRKNYKRRVAEITAPSVLEAKKERLREKKKMGRSPVEYDRVELRDMVKCVIDNPKYRRAGKPNVRAIARYIKEDNGGYEHNVSDRKLRDIVAGIIAEFFPG